MSLKIHIDNKKLAKRMREIREDMDISRQELASMIGRNTRSISKIELEGSFSFETFVALCKALKKDSNYFICGIQTDLTLVEEVAANIHRLKKPEHLKAILAIIDVWAKSENMFEIDVIVE